MQMTSEPSYSDVAELLSESITCMLMRVNVPVTHAHDWKRPEGWPLPAVRVHEQGLITQDYRPLAVIEWCEYKLDEPRRVSQAQARAAARGAA